MKIIYFFTITLLSVLAAAACGCIHSAPVPDDVKSSAPGFGSSKQAPYGTVLGFPSGVVIAGKPHWDRECFDEAAKQGKILGNGQEQFCIQFVNSNKATTAVTIPSGTVFVSESTDYPNALITKTIQISIPATSSVSFQFLVHSINQTRKDPGTNAAFDAKPVVTDHEGIAELATLLAHKKVNAEDYYGEIPPSEVTSTVRKAVHEIAHTGKMSTDSRMKLSNLLSL